MKSWLNRQPYDCPTGRLARPPVAPVPAQPPTKPPTGNQTTPTDPTNPAPPPAIRSRDEPTTHPPPHPHIRVAKGRHVTSPDHTQDFAAGHTGTGNNQEHRRRGVGPAKTSRAPGTPTGAAVSGHTSPRANRLACRRDPNPGGSDTPKAAVRGLRRSPQALRRQPFDASPTGMVTG